MILTMTAAASILSKQMYHTVGGAELVEEGLKRVDDDQIEAGHRKRRAVVHSRGLGQHFWVLCGEQEQRRWR